MLPAPTPPPRRSGLIAPRHPFLPRFVVGGAKYNNYGEQIFLDKVQRYDLASSSWLSNAPPMPTSRKFATALALLDDDDGGGGAILVAGGEESDDLHTQTVSRYSVASSSWASLPSLPAARFGLVSGAYTTSRLMFVGGWGTTYSDRVYQYDLEMRCGGGGASGAKWTGAGSDPLDLVGHGHR